MIRWKIVGIAVFAAPLALLFLSSCIVTKSIVINAWFDIKLHPQDEKSVTDSSSLIALLGATGVSPAQLDFVKRADGTVSICARADLTATFDMSKIQSIFRSSAPGFELPIPNFSLPEASTLRVRNAGAASMYVASIYIDGTTVFTTGTTIGAGSSRDFFIPASIAPGYNTLKFTYGPSRSRTETVFVSDYISASKAYIAGDVNGDGSVNLGDPSFLLNYLFSGGPSTWCDLAADVDKNDRINLSDAVYLLNHLFVGGSSSLSGPACARQLDPGLGCYYGC